MSPAFPFSDPNCSSSGTNCYLVFLEDNTNRTSLNRTMAMFSKYDGTMWALPVPLGDDGTADFHPRILTFADGSAVAAGKTSANRAARPLPLLATWFRILRCRSLGIVRL